MRKPAPRLLQSLTVVIEPTKKLAALNLQAKTGQAIVDSIGTAVIVLTQSRDFKISVKPRWRKPAKGKK